MLVRLFKRHAALAFILIWGVCASVGVLSPKIFSVLAFVDKWLSDLRLTTIAETMEPHPDIVLLTITEDTLARYPYRFPVDRGMIADAIERLNGAGVRAIGLDILFDQPTEAGKDRRLARAVEASAAPVVVGWASEDEALTEKQIAHLRTFLPKAIQAPSNLIKDGADGTVRWIYPGTDEDAGFRTAFAPALARAAGAEPGREPLNLYYRRGVDGGAAPFRIFPLHLLPHLPPQWFADKIVIVGADLPNDDRHRSPFAALLGNDAGSLPGVVIHAHAVAQLIDGVSYAEGNLLVETVVASLVAGFGVGIALLGVGLIAKIAIAGVTLVTIWAIGFGLFAFVTVMIPLFAPTLTFASALGLSAAAIAHRYKLKKQFAEAMVQRRNESLHKVVENSFDGIVVTTSDGRIVATNTSADYLMGWEPDDAIGSDITAHIPDADAYGAHFLDLDASAQRSRDDDIRPLEVDCLRADGSGFTMELLIYTASMSFEDSDSTAVAGERISYIYSFRDVTARKLAEQERENARKEAEAANRAKTEFLANMSHELRTPLNAIIGFSEIMKSEALGPLGAPQYLDYLNDIHSSGVHLTEIVNDILDMSKIEAGELKPNEEAFDFGRVADVSMRLVADRAHGGEVTLTNSVPAGLPELLADQRMIKQILLNLLSNAVKFTPAGGSVTLTAAVDDSGFAFSVSDTGCGIPEDKLDVILEPFGQADMSLQRKFEGTGLGLPLVKAMAELHDGTLAIETAVGEGTTATVRMPPERLMDRPRKIA